MDANERDAEIERLGREWQGRSNEYLVGYVSSIRHQQFHTPAIVEMMRRQILAIDRFSEASGKQATTMIRLTWSIIALTVILGIIACVQLWAMLAKGA